MPTTPSRVHRRPAVEAAQAAAGRRRFRRRQALTTGLLGTALGLMAVAAPAAAGVIGAQPPTAPAVPAADAVRVHGAVTMGIDGVAPSAPVTAATTPPPPSPAPAPAATTPPEASTATPAAAAPSTAPRPAPLAAAAPAPADASAEAQVLALVNQQRAAAGCAALTASTALADLARAHSADMRDRGYFAHDTPEGVSPFTRAQQAGITTMRAENIAMGQAGPAEVMTAWMNSPGHRANILDCSLKTLGVGVAEGAGGPWWTQDFGV